MRAEVNLRELDEVLNKLGSASEAGVHLEASEVPNDAEPSDALGSPADLVHG